MLPSTALQIRAWATAEFLAPKWIKVALSHLECCALRRHAVPRRRVLHGFYRHHGKVVSRDQAADLGAAARYSHCGASKWQAARVSWGLSSTSGDGSRTDRPGTIEGRLWMFRTFLYFLSCGWAPRPHPSTNMRGRWRKVSRMPWITNFVTKNLPNRRKPSVQVFSGANMDSQEGLNHRHQDYRRRFSPLFFQNKTSFM